MTLVPSGTAFLTYSREPATISLNYQHVTVPNLGTGQLDDTDAVAARFSMPIGAETIGLATAGSVGLSRASAIGGDGVRGVTADVFVADAAATYVPPFAQTLSAGLRFQIARQVSGSATLPAFTTYGVALSLAFSYPSANRARERPRLTPVFSVAPTAPADIVSSDPPRVEARPPPTETP
jgi:hypothetical protein